MKMAQLKLMRVAEVHQQSQTELAARLLSWADFTMVCHCRYIVYTFFQRSAL